MATSEIRLNDPSLLVGKSYINGEWVESVSKNRFDVFGKLPRLERFNTGDVGWPLTCACLQIRRLVSILVLAQNQPPKMRKKR
jgi:hypothetical protein